MDVRRFIKIRIPKWVIHISFDAKIIITTLFLLHNNIIILSLLHGLPPPSPTIYRVGLKT